MEESVSVPFSLRNVIFRVRKWIAALSRRYGKADFIQPSFSKLKVPGYETVDSFILLPLPEYTLDDKKACFARGWI